MTSINILSQSSAVILTLILSIIFLASGIYYSRKLQECIDGINSILYGHRISFQSKKGQKGTKST